ncbi:MAG TPA: hypothetical protein VG820_04440, partial [Fimbriimonadaceae bacterium]|nr:hypothetical protein [Fimbriimonadaceae bacterium]
WKRLAQFMAQITVETGGGHEMTESLSYRPETLATTSPWDTRMTWKDMQRYGWVPHKHPADIAKLAEIGYGGRMGNLTAKDALDFIGHGFLQKTGRDDYQHLTDTLGKKYGVDFVKDPKALNDAAHALEYAADEFVSYKQGKQSMLDLADQWKTKAVSELVNGGDNLLAKRIKSANDWLKLLTAPKTPKAPKTKKKHPA